MFFLFVFYKKEDKKLNKNKKKNTNFQIKSGRLKENFFKNDLLIHDFFLHFFFFCEK